MSFSADIPLERTFRTSDGALADNVPYQVALLCLLIFYIYTVMRGYGEASLVLRLSRSRHREKRTAEEYPIILSAFARRMGAAGLVGAGFAILRAAEIWGGLDVADKWSPVPLGIIVAVVAVIVLVASLQHLFLAAVGNLTLESALTERLAWKKTLFFVAGSVVSMPLAMLAAVAPEMWAQAFLAGWAALGVVFMFGYVLSTGKLFRRQKVSILVWILYLCGVESMPYAVLFVLLARVLKTV
jgi:hypothetical protein